MASLQAQVVDQLQEWVGSRLHTDCTPVLPKFPLRPTFSVIAIKTWGTLVTDLL